MATQDPRPAGVRELPLVGGHLALDFANTVDDPLGRARFDHVGDEAGLRYWAERLGLLPSERTDPEPGAVVAAAALRADVNAVIGAFAGHDELDRPAWERLSAAGAAALGRATLREERQRVLLDWPVSLQGVLDRIAVAAVDLVRSDELRRVKRCGGCPWLFVDRSRNGSRRWCSMDDCGRHEKIVRIGAKRAAARAS